MSLPKIIAVRNDEATRLRQRLAAEHDDNERATLLHTLVGQWPDDPETRPLLHELVHTDPSFLVRDQAMRSLALRWRDDRSRDALQTVITTDPEYLVAKEAGAFLHMFWPGDPATLRTTIADDDFRVRAVASHELGDLLDGMRLADADSYTLIRDRAANDTSPEVRAAALHAVGRTRDPEAFDLVRHAVTAPEAIAGLRDHVAADSFAESRHDAVKYLLGDFVADPGVRALLFRIAEHHPRALIRLDVIHTLTRETPGDDTVELLVRLAATDAEPDVRQQLLVEIVRALEDDDTVTGFLTARAEQDPDAEVRELATNLLADPEDTLDLWD